MIRASFWMTAASSMRWIAPICLLPLGLATDSLAASSQGLGGARAEEPHSTTHPFVLASDADFLVALIALYQESLDASLVAKGLTHSKKIKIYADRVAASHRSEIARFRKLLARLRTEGKPDFHFESRVPGLRKRFGAAADRYYLSGLSELTAAKIELAEFASGTVQSRTVKRLAQDIFEGKSEELTMLNQWAKQYGTN